MLRREGLPFALGASIRNPFSRDLLFDENVAPELRLIFRGRKRLVPVTELERWVAQTASTPAMEEVANAFNGRR
jgi:hypothetical protein